MLSFKKTAIAGLLGLAAIAATPARADLIVSCTSTTNPGGCTVPPWGTVNPGNGFYVFNGTSGPYSVTELISGNDILAGPPVLTVHNFEIDVTGPGQLSVFVTEDHLTGSGPAAFLMSFGTSNITGGMDPVTRILWLDYGTANQFQLGICTGGDGTACKYTSASVNLTGSYSLTEEFDLNSTSCSGVNACQLSTDDKFSLVPEPTALSIFGLGLLALGGLGWRRRNNANPPAV